jgi:hypothetical protein
MQVTLSIPARTRRNLPCMAGEADAADPTELAGVAEMGTEAVEAWSTAEDYPLTGSWEDPERRWTPARITTLAVAAGVAVIAAAGGAIWWQLQREQPVHTTHVVVATETATAVAPEPPKPPPPSTVTQTVQAPAPTRPPSAADIARADPGPTPAQDAYFLDLVRGDGWNVTNGPLAISKAHEFCRKLRSGVDVGVLNQQIARDSGYGYDTALMFTTDAMQAYPGCRFGVG